MKLKYLLILLISVILASCMKMTYNKDEVNEFILDHLRGDTVVTVQLKVKVDSVDLSELRYKKNLIIKTLYNHGLEMTKALIRDCYFDDDTIDVSYEIKCNPVNHTD